LKIVWLGTYREDSCARFFRRKLGETVEVINYGEGPGSNPRLTHGYTLPSKEEWIYSYDAKEMEEKEKPDWFVVYAYVSNQYFWPFLKNLENVNTPRTIIINDPIQDAQGILPKLSEWKISKVFCVYSSDSLVDLYRKRYEADYYSLPYSIDTKIFRPTGENREYDLAFAGSTSAKWYPLRDQIMNTWKNLPQKYKTFSHSGHLGLTEYISLINRTKIFLVEGGIYNYPVAKYFETMACNTLVLGTEPLDADLLHFKLGVNIAPIRMDHMLEDQIYWIENEEERKKLSENGYQTILKYHTNEIRVKEFLERLK